MPWFSTLLPVLFLATLGVKRTSATARISLAQVDYVVQEAEGSQFSVLVLKEGDATNKISVVVRIMNADAYGGNDFIGASQTTVFEPGQESIIRSIIFTISDDNLPEPDETFAMTLLITNGDAILTNPVNGSVTIVANDDGFGIFGFQSLSTVYTKELLEDHFVSLNIVRSRGAFGQVDIFYQVTGDTLGSDIQPLQGSVKFENGQSVQQLNLKIMHDEVPENDEVFTIRLTQASGGSSVLPSGNRPQINHSSSEVELVIRRNDAPIKFAQAEYRVDEGNMDQTLFIEVTRGLDGMTQLGPIDQPASVEYYFYPVSCTPDEDYIASNGSIGFSPGTQKTTIPITILSDSIPEVEETFLLMLFNPNGDVVISEPNTATIIISANDDPNGIISIKAVDGMVRPVFYINEDEARIASIEIIRNGGTFGQVSVDWILESNYTKFDDDEIDIFPSVGTLTFKQGEGQKSLVFNIIQDNIPERSELFVLKLLPWTVNGGARVEGVTEAELIIEDSDNGHGIVQFNPNDFQDLDSSTTPRRLILSLSRSGGTLDTLRVYYNVDYVSAESGSIPASEILLSRLPGSVSLEAGQTSYTIEILIRNEAFLHVGAYFNVTLITVELNTPSDVGAFNTPRLGSMNSIVVHVKADDANGEVGFENLNTIYVDEPTSDKLTTQVTIPIVRVGTNGGAHIYWKITASGSNPDHITVNDLVPTEGNLSMSSGQGAGNIIFSILPDDLAEMDEQITVTLVQVEPSSTQRLKPDARAVNVIIRENDSPGGVFEIADSMAPFNFSVEEEKDVIEITIVRRGAALVAREIEYYIEPDGEEEFYGSLNVIKFKPGEVMKKINVIARKDGIPELTEHFTLKLRSFGDKVAKIGPRNSLEITVFANEVPYGRFQFPSEDYTVVINETKDDVIGMAQLAVQRVQGNFETSSVTWMIDLTDDLEPLSGELTFDPGVAVMYIEVTALDDVIPEGIEVFDVMLTSSKGKAVLGEYLTAKIEVRQNDDAIYFKEPSIVRLPEPGEWTLTVVREGPTERINSVRYRTVPGIETEGGSDFVLDEGQLIFDFGEKEKHIHVTVLADDLAEPDESFTVMLYDAKGDVSVYGTPNATLIISANDKANGVFRFVAPFSQTASEDQTVQFEVIREVGHYYEAYVYYEILHASSGLRVEDGKDFKHGVGYCYFKDLQELSFVTVKPINDLEPEFAEAFIIRLFNVTVTKLDLESGLLASVDQSVTLNVLESNDPHGVMFFPVTSREVSIAEDILPGDEDKMKGNLTVKRRNGAYGLVEVVWEAFSYKIAGANSFPQILDLLFLAEVTNTVTKVPGAARPGTGTVVIQFDGCSRCFVNVAPDYQPTSEDVRSGFSISAWIQPKPNTQGYIVSKTSPDGSQHFYALKVSLVNGASFNSITIEFRYSLVDSPSNQVLMQSVSDNVADGDWHLVIISVLEDACTFYLDGIKLSTKAMAGSLIADGAGVMLVGAANPSVDPFEGLMQDVRWYSRTLDEGEVREVFLTPSVEDISPISGYLTFPEDVRTQEIHIDALQDIEEETNQLFSVRIISAKYGARISNEDSSAVLTVLKSDNANGLFGFSGHCSAANPGSEDTIIQCPVTRSRGDADEVKVMYEVMKNIGTGWIIAAEDFVNATGYITFEPGDRIKLITVKVMDDMEPETAEDFEIVLVNAVSSDKIVGTTPTSGASIDSNASTQNITLPESDYPYGLIEFSVLDDPPLPDDPRIPPAETPPQIVVPEEAGTITLLVVRAQGLLGEVGVEWRTVDGTAKSAGKTPPDFVVSVSA